MPRFQCNAVSTTLPWRAILQYLLVTFTQDNSSNVLAHCRPTLWGSICFVLVCIVACLSGPFTNWFAYKVSQKSASYVSQTNWWSNGRPINSHNLACSVQHPWGTIITHWEWLVLYGIPSPLHDLSCFVSCSIATLHKQKAENITNFSDTALFP